MSVPSVTLPELDGQLGVLPDGEKALAIAGPSSAGTADLPSTFAKTADVVAAFDEGPLVEAGCYFIANYSRPVVLCRTGATTAATQAAIDTTGVLGSSVVTYGADTTAFDDYDLYFEVATGGTIGVAGITFRWSLDGGFTRSPLTALGTATTWAFPNSGGVGFAFAAGTLLAGDKIRGRTFAPAPNGTEIGSALNALRLTSVRWDLVNLAFPLDATLFDAVETAFGAGNMVKRAWIGNTRTPTTGESPATYLAALSGVFGSKATTRGVLCAGAADITSGHTFRKYRRPISHAVGAFAASVSEEIDLADVNLGNLPGVSIRDANGNPKHHDEFINPGLDDARFCTLRTWDEEQGVYVNNPRIFSTSGSDFEFLQHRRVMNLFRATLDRYFTRRLSKAIIVSRKTGRILESEAATIDSEVNALCEAVLMAKPKASGGGISVGSGAPQFVRISRTDNLISTKKLTGQGAVVPLAYPKAIEIPIGFRNPALQIVQV
jgi:hypothetical protein